MSEKTDEVVRLEAELAAARAELPGCDPKRAVDLHFRVSNLSTVLHMARSEAQREAKLQALTLQAREPFPKVRPYFPPSSTPLLPAEARAFLRDTALDLSEACGEPAEDLVRDVAEALRRRPAEGGDA